MLGPVLGQALYSLVNFEITFYIFGGALSLAMIIVMIIIPSHLNHADDVATKEEIDLYFERLKSTDSATNSFNHIPFPRRSDIKTTLSRDVTYWMFLKNRRAMMATVSAVFAMIFMLFFDSILTMYLISELKIGENSAGKINSIVTII